MGEDDNSVKISKYGKAYSIEKKILKPYFKPTKKTEKGMATYTLLQTDKRIIFPYDIDGNLIDLDTMQDAFSGSFAYLNDCYDRLIPKTMNNGVGRDIPNATIENWYQYGRTQSLTAFINTPKLIVRVLSKQPMYAYDDKNMLIASGGTAGYCAISELKDAGYCLEYIQAWLVHPYTEKIFRIMGSDFENGFTARGTYLLKKTPIVVLNFNDANQKQIYEFVVGSTRKIYKLCEEMQNKTDKATVSVLEKEKNKLIKQIEDAITKVYQQDFR